MKILFTTVCRPIGPSQGDGESVGYELLFGQVTRAQGIFSPRATHFNFSLNYIAQNIDAPCTVLQYPSRKELIKELKHTRYDYVGIPFVLATFHHLKSTVAVIREHAPRAKIVLGSYGTIVSDEELRPYGDFICREEGVAFMRKLLGEQPGPMPYNHPHMVSTLKVFSIPVSRTGMVFGGLGCANGCDFCCTSHFFKSEHIPLLPTGNDLFSVFCDYQDNDPKILFTVIDEDFLLNKKRAMEFRELVMCHNRYFSIFAFASVKALSQYKVAELVEMGIDGLWIGYEGTRSGYSKQDGRSLDELFLDLKRHGIQVLASMILGFDYQTPDIIRDEMRKLFLLKPAFCQFLIYGPTPGTPFYKRVVKEDKLHPEMKKDPLLYYKNCSGFRSMVIHPTMSHEEIEEMQSWGFEQDFQRNGPSIYRTIRVWLEGCKYLRGSENPVFRQRARMLSLDTRRASMIFLAGRIFAPNRRIRRWIAAMEKRVYLMCGKPTWRERFMSVLAVGAALWTRFTLCFDYFQHPRLTMTRYRWDYSDGVLIRLWGEILESGEAAELRVIFQKRRTEGWVRIRLHGVMDGKNVAELGRRFTDMLTKGRKRCIINFSDVKSIDRKGLAAFYRACRRFRSRIQIEIPNDRFADKPDLRTLAIYFSVADKSIV